MSYLSVRHATIRASVRVRVIDISIIRIIRGGGTGRGRHVESPLLMTRSLLAFFFLVTKELFVCWTTRPEKKKTKQSHRKSHPTSSSSPFLPACRPSQTCRNKRHSRTSRRTATSFWTIKSNSWSTRLPWSWVLVVFFNVNRLTENERTRKRQGFGYRFLLFERNETETFQKTTLVGRTTNLADIATLFFNYLFKKQPFSFLFKLKKTKTHTHTHTNLFFV